ncbi:MAG: hypothetical protein Q7K34_00275, partial [archaeon]|nr:hypothetical protein [archaeon]
AMYSIFFLGNVVLLESFGVEVPQWLSPLITFAVIGYFFWKSKKEIAKEVILQKKPGTQKPGKEE